MPYSGTPPVIVTGGRPSVVSTSAPIVRSGLATRSIGRLRIDSSPSRVKTPLGCIAQMPVRSRISVPALRTSIAPTGGLRPAMPTPWTVSRPWP